MDNLGLVYRRAGKLDEAITWYKKSIAVAPKNGTSRMNLAAALRMKKQLPESATEYAGLIKVLPKDPEGHYGLGSVYLDMGKAKEAVAPLLEAEKLYQAEQSPYVRDARVNIADAYYQLEQWPDAAKYFELIYLSSQEDPTTNLRFGTTLLKLKKQARARTILGKARDLGAVVPAEIAKQAGL